MKSTAKTLLFAIPMLIVATLIVETAEARRDQARQRFQKGRIADGVKDGSLTPNETRKLIRGQRRIDRAQERATADGVVTDKERFKLEKRQDNQNRKIYREKHDNQTQGAPPAEGAAAQPAPGQ